MRALSIFLLLMATLSAECVLIMTTNAQMSRYYAEAFRKEGLQTKMIASIPARIQLEDDETALAIVHQSRCEYALFMPISIKSKNMNGKMDLEGSIKLYRQDTGRFKTITWSEKSDEKIIDLQERDAQTKIKARFVRLTSSKAIEYFKGQ